MVLLCFIWIVFSETNGSLKNRIGRMPEEWNTLISYNKRFGTENKWNSYANLLNYMLGFAEAMYKDCEYLYDLYRDTWFYEQSQFYFSQYQDLKRTVDPKSDLFRYYYYNAGFNRVDNGTDKFGYYDF
jgi:hypothetical protein